jgi:hypothetical protein
VAGGPTSSRFIIDEPNPTNSDIFLARPGEGDYFDDDQEAITINPIISQKDQQQAGKFYCKKIYGLNSEKKGQEIGSEPG